VKFLTKEEAAPLQAIMTEHRKNHLASHLQTLAEAYKSKDPKAMEEALSNIAFSEEPKKASPNF
jgi:hypothetical protein